MKKVMKRILLVMLCILILASIIPMSMFKSNAATSGYTLHMYYSRIYRGTKYGEPFHLFNVRTAPKGGTVNTGEIIYCIDHGATVNKSTEGYTETTSEAYSYFNNLSTAQKRGLRWVSMYGYHANHTGVPIDDGHDVAARAATQALVWDILSGAIFTNKTNPTWGNFESESNWMKMTEKDGETLSQYAQVVTYTTQFGTQYWSDGQNGVSGRTSAQVAADVEAFKTEYKKLFNKVTNHRTEISFALNLADVTSNNSTKTKPVYTLASSNSITLTDTNGALQYCDVRKDIFVYCSVAEDKTKLGIDTNGHCTDNTHFKINNNKLIIQADSPLAGQVSVRIAKGGFANDNKDAVFFSSGYQPLMWRISDPFGAFFDLKSSDTINISKTSLTGSSVSGIAFRFRNENKNKYYGETSGTDTMITDSAGGFSTPLKAKLSDVVVFGTEQYYDFVELRQSGMEDINQITIVVQKSDGTDRERVVISRDSYVHTRNNSTYKNMTPAGVNANNQTYFNLTTTDGYLRFGAYKDSSGDLGSQGVWGVPLKIYEGDRIYFEAVNGEGGNAEIIKTVSGSASNSANGWTFNVYESNPSSPTYYYTTKTATGAKSYSLSGVSYGFATGSPIIEVYVNNVLWPASGTNYYTFTRSSSTAGTLTFNGTVVPQSGDKIYVVYKTYNGRNNSPKYTVTTEKMNGTNGRALLENLTPGTYYVEEVPKSGYEWPGSTKIVTVTNGGTGTVTFDNTPLTGTKTYILKTLTSGSTGTISDWQFYAQTSESNLRYYSKTVTSTGASSYTVTVSTTHPYASSSPVVEVYVNDSLWPTSGDSYYTFTRNSSTSGTLKFLGDIVPLKGEAITVVYRTSKSTGTNLGTTNANGLITSNTLAAGSYYIEEVPRVGYKYCERKQVTVNSNAITTVSFENTPLSTRLLLKKTLADGTTGRLDGWRFTLYDETVYNYLKDNSITAFEQGTYDVVYDDDVLSLSPLDYGAKSSNITVIEVYCNGILLIDGDDYQAQNGYIDFRYEVFEGDVLDIIYRNSNTGDCPIYTTDTNGYISVDDLPAGTYYIEEAPSLGYEPSGSNPQEITISNYTTTTVTFENQSNTKIEIKKQFTDGSTGTLDGWRFVMYTTSLPSQPLVHVNSFSCDQYGRWQDVGYEKSDYFDYGVYDILAVYVNGEIATYTSQGDGELTLTCDFEEGDEITVVYTTKYLSYTILGPTDSSGKISTTVSPGTYYIEEIPQYGYEIPAKQTAVITTQSISLTFTNTQKTILKLQKKLADGVTGSIAGIQFAIYTEANYENVMSDTTAFEMVTHIATVEDENNRFLDLAAIDPASSQNEGIFALYYNGTLMEDGYDYQVSQDGEIIYFQELLEGDLVQIVYKKYHSGTVSIYTTDSNGQIITTDFTEGTYYIEELPNPRYVTQAPKKVTITSGTTTSVEFVNTMSSLEIIKEFAEDITDSKEGWRFVQYSSNANSSIPLVYMDSFPCDQKGYWQDVGFENQDYFNYGVYDILAAYVNGEPATFSSRVDGELCLTCDFDEGDEITVVYTTQDDIRYTVLGPTDTEGKLSADNIAGGVYYIEEIPQYGYQIPEKQKIIVSGQEKITITMENKPVVYPGEIQIEKVNLQNQPLEGAHFILQYREVGSSEWNTAIYTDDNAELEAGYFYTEQIINEDNSISTDDDGIAKFSQLKADGSIEYQLVEVQAPEGCELMQSPIYVGALPSQTTFESKSELIEWKENYKYDSADYIVIGLTANQYHVYYCVVNNAIILPTPTGGNGLMIVTLGSIGVAIVALITGMMLKKRKKGFWI